MLEVKELSKAFAEVNVLNNIDLNVDQGEFLVLVGPSGCGKSTLIRSIAGLEKPRMPQPFVYAQLINQFGHAKFYPSAPLKRRQTDCPDRSVGFSLERPQIALAHRYDGT